MLVFFFAVSGACAGNRVPHVAPDESRPHITWEIRSRESGESRFVCGSIEPSRPCVLAASASRQGTGVTVQLYLHAASTQTSYLGLMETPFVDGVKERGDQHHRSARESAGLFAAQWKSDRGPWHLPAQHRARRHSNRRRRSDQDHAADPRSRQRPGNRVCSARSAVSRSIVAARAPTSHSHQPSADSERVSAKIRGSQPALHHSEVRDDPCVCPESASSACTSCRVWAFSLDVRRVARSSAPASNWCSSTSQSLTTSGSR